MILKKSVYLGGLLDFSAKRLKFELAEETKI